MGQRVPRAQRSWLEIVKGAEGSTLRDPNVGEQAELFPADALPPVRPDRPTGSGARIQSDGGGGDQSVSLAR